MVDSDTECFELINVELLPRILVKDPVTHETWDQGKFTTYLICIKTEHPAFHLRLSAVRRRFSELVWLDKVLRSNHSHIHFPRSPSKKVFAERFEPDFISSRMMEIQSFLNELLVTDNVLSDAAFHLFIQTDLTTSEIEEHLNGSLPENMVKEAWDNAGHLHSSSYIVNTTVIPHEPQEIAMNEEDLALRNSQSFDASNSFSGLENTAISEPENSDVFLNSSASAATILDEVADLSNLNNAVTSNNDVVTSSNCVLTPGNDVLTPGNDVVTSNNDVVTSSKDTMTSNDDINSK